MTRALPSVNAALFDEDGEATRVLRAVLDGLPDGPLLDEEYRATRLFRAYLSDVATAPLPSNFEPLADEDGRPTRAMTLLLMGLP